MFVCLIACPLANLFGCFFMVGVTVCLLVCVCGCLFACVFACVFDCVFVYWCGFVLILRVC